MSGRNVAFRRIVEFLNEQMNPAEVLAVEIKQFAGKGLKTLVPLVMGQTAEAQQKKSTGVQRTKRKWDEASFLASLRDRTDPVSVEIAEKLLAWAKKHALYIWWGEGRQDGSFIPVFEKNGNKQYLFVAWTYGAIEIYFYQMKNFPPFDKKEKRLELLRRLNEVPGIDIPESALDKLPNFAFSILQSQEAYSDLMKAFDYFLAEIEVLNGAEG